MRVPMLVVVLLVLIGTGSGAATSTAGAEPRPAVDRAASASPHVIVWDSWRRDRKGIHVVAANEDGSERHRVYDSRIGFTMDLFVDPGGQRVAFATCCSDHLPPMVVAPLDGGTVLRPLARHRQLYAVGPITWSRDGQRLAFVGYRLVGKRIDHALWTVRPDGTGLRRIVGMSKVDGNGWPERGMAWTNRGIVFTDRGRLYVARHGHARLMLRRVISVVTSGNGKHLLLRRGNSYWSASNDGTDLQLVAGGRAFPSYQGLVLDHSGRRVLASRTRLVDGETVMELVTWRIGESPRTARVVDATSYAPVFAWS